MLFCGLIMNLLKKNFVMKKILFYNCDIFEIENYQSILCTNTEEIKSLFSKENKIHFILFPEEMNKIEEVISSLKDFFYYKKIHKYPVFIQVSNNVLHEHCPSWVIYQKNIIPVMIKQWIF